MTQAKAPAKTADSTTAVLRPSEKLVQDLAKLAQLDNANGEAAFEIASRVVDDIMSAKTEDEIFDAADAGLTSLKDSQYIDHVIGILDVRYNKSDTKYKGGVGAYAVMDIVSEDGELDTVSVGAPNVVAQVRQAQTLGLISETKPWKVRPSQKPTQNGELLTLKKP